MLSWTMILYAMLQLQAPGRSIYSRIEVPEDAPAPCAEPTILCTSPTFDRARDAWTVAENNDQGLARYAAIAQVLEKVAMKSDAPTVLARYLLTVTFHESGFRRDVQEGVGEAARGDCKWQTVGGRRVRVAGSCKSHCLAQILLLKGEKTAEGYTPSDLVGLDDEATERCLTVAARYLEVSKRGCAFAGQGGAECVIARYGGMRTGTGDPRVKSRAATFHRIRFVELDDETRAKLGLEPLGEG